MPRHRSPGQYVRTPRRTWRDQWSSHAPLKHSDRCPSCRTSPRCEASAAKALGGTRLPLSGSGCWRKDADASTLPNRTPAQNPTATTLLGSAFISTGRWRPPTRHRTLLLAVEPLQQGKTPGRLGTTDRSTPFRRKTEPRNLRSYESSRRNSTKIVSALFCSSKSLSRTCLTRLAEASADGLERCTGRSSETGSQSNLSAAFLERARMWWQQ